MVSAAVRFWKRAAYCFGSESAYKSFSDSFKAMALRMAAEPGKGGFLKNSPPVFAVHLKDLKTPLYVRRTNSDFLVLRDIFEDGEYVPTKDFHLPDDAKILDLGGNIGLSVVYLGNILPKSHIVALEPDRDNLHMLRVNGRHLIKQGRLEPVNAFVAATDGQAGIDRSETAWSFRKTEANGSGETIPCLSIPSILAKTGWDKIDLLKVDIEGTEKELFADCGPWIHKVRNLIVETHPPYFPADLENDLKRAGWNYKTIYAALYQPAPRVFFQKID